MTPGDAIALLDRQIAQHGQKIGLRRLNFGAWELRAWSRGYRADELAGGVQQGDTLVIVSPTDLAASGFTGGALKRLDRITVSGRERSVEIADPVTIGDTVVRWNLTVRG